MHCVGQIKFAIWGTLPAALNAKVLNKHLTRFVSAWRVCFYLLFVKLTDLEPFI